MRRVFLGLASVVILLGAVMVVHALSLRPESVPVDVGPLTQVKIDEKAVVQRFTEALRIDTVSNEDKSKKSYPQILELQKLMQKQFPHVFQKLELEHINTYSLLFRWKGKHSDLPAVLLCNHQDVVPAETGAGHHWNVPPFSAEIKDGFIHARGAMDDKGPLWSLLEAVEAKLAEGNFQPETDIYLAFGHDEEIGGSQGAAKIAERLAQRGVKFEFVLDEGGAVINGSDLGVNRDFAKIGISEKGFLDLRLSVRGEAGHSSMPPAHTAIGVLAAAIERLENHPFPPRMTEPIDKMLIGMAPEMPFMKKLFLGNRWITEPLVMEKLGNDPYTKSFLKTTTAVTMISGGVKDNVLPSEAHALVNFRILPGMKADEVRDYAVRVINDPAVQVEVDDTNVHMDGPSVSSTTSPGYQKIVRAIWAVDKNVLISPSMTPGMTDSRWYRNMTDNIYRFAFMRLMPTDLKRFHGDNERVGTSNYVEMIRFYLQLIESLGSSAHPVASR